MAKERLSKLQKWVLVEAYKNKCEYESSFEKRTEYKLMKRKIYENFFNIKLEKHGYADFETECNFRIPKEEKTKIVILSRSLNKLRNRGLIRPSYGALNIATMFGGRANIGSEVYLTEKGIEKAKELLKV